MQHLQPNTTLQGGKYRIERMLGQGGFGITYLAVQTSLQRKVAIKEFFMKEFCSRDEVTHTMSTPSMGSSKLVEQYRKKFIKEARNLARLNHPHIISVMDVFEENGTVYYVMPYLIGGSLQDYVKAHGPLSESMAMKYVRQIAGALKYMHEEQHICHYDVKPANILLDDKENALLIDFGISKNYDAAGQETTTTPVGLSEGYAPIEQYQQNVEEFSPVSDVYALGATLYFLLHGKRPVSAVHRAGGNALLMSKQLSQGIKDIINASMKISKRERAKSMDVFMGNISTSTYRKSTVVQDDDESTILDGSQRTKGTNTTYTQSYSPIVNPSASEGKSNSGIGWIIGIAVAVIIGILIYNSQGDADKPSNAESYVNPVEATPPSTTQQSQNQSSSAIVEKTQSPVEVFDNKMNACSWLRNTSGTYNFMYPDFMNSSSHFMDDVPGDVEVYSWQSVQLAYWPLLGYWAVDSFADTGNWVSYNSKVSNVTYKSERLGIYSGYTNDGRIYYLKTKVLNGGDVPHATVLALIYPPEFKEYIKELTEVVRTW